ncbi:MAG: DnaJ domain-containing protein [bacterium]
MSWQGKMIGGGIGSFLGPWGAVCGATFGHFMVDRKKAVDQKKEAMRLMALIAAAFHELACCDGAYSKAEDHAIRSVLSDFNARMGSPLDTHSLLFLIDDAERIDRGVERLAMMLRPHRELAQEALRWFWHIALCDGALTKYEEARIDHFVRVAGMPPQEAHYIASQFVDQYTTIEQSCRAAYDVLGISYDASLETIKQTYRAMSLKYHPDKHADLAPDIRALTAEKFAQIKQAYDTLCKHSPEVG